MFQDLIPLEAPGPAPAIGLVLGGGGARGFGHIVMLEAFDELGLRPAAIAGCSIGAILGAAYAGGLSAAEIRDAALATFRDSGAALGRLWALRPRRLNEMFSGRIGQFDAERLLEAFVGPFLPDSFEACALPFAVVATDFYGARTVIFRNGPLKPAVAASIALPILFRPVAYDGAVLIDGGVTDPVPVDALPAPVDLVVAVDVVALPEPRDDLGIPATVETAVGAAQLLMASLADAKFQLSPPDMLFRPPVGRFHVLDFLKAREIIDACAPEKDEVKRRITRLMESPTLLTD
jgi:NTE family protein